MNSSKIRSSGVTQPIVWLVSIMLVAAVMFSPSAASGQAKAQKAAPAAAATVDGATYVGEETCLGCHENKKGSGGYHAQIADKRTPSGGKGCESCHGPGSKHADDPEKVKPLQFNKVAADVASAQCTGCHTSGEHAFWANSKHEARNVACTSCHSIHSPKGAKLVKAESQAALCQNCHRNIVNKITRFNHMPVREGALQCSQCHNIHGSPNVKMLRAGTTVDESCVSCHQEKRGPYLWEHAPVANSCVTCHDPHGSSNDRMLVAKAPYLCQRCHVTSRHPPTVYDQFVAKNSSNANKITGRSCMNCHQQIHGSNSPNGKALLR